MGILSSLFHQKSRTVFCVAIGVLRWLTLFLLGVLAYVSIKALWIIINLGTSMYDWQWYIPLAMLLICIPMPFALNRTYSRYTILLISCLLVWVLIGFNGFGYVENLSLQDKPSTPIAFWMGSIGQPSETLLSDVQKAQATLYVLAPIPLEGEESANFLAELKLLDKYNIPVVIFVPASDFLSAPVHREWMANVEQVAAFIKREELTNVRGLIGDAEAPRFTPFDSFRSDIPDVLQATERLEEFLNKYHQNYADIPIGVTAAWQLHLDRLDGDADLSILYRSPVNPPDDWDFVSVMNYSSYYPQGWRAYLVRQVINHMENRYPNASRIHLIGLVGGGFPWEPVLDFKGIVQDAQIGRALGVEEIVVFQLKGAIEDFGEDFVQQFSRAVNGSLAPDKVVVPFSRPASLWLYYFAALDAGLDLFDSRIWLLPFWIIMSFSIMMRVDRTQ